MHNFDSLGYLQNEIFEKFTINKFSLLRDNLFLRGIKYNNIEILKGHKLNNLIYHPCIGYSKINNYLPLVKNNNVKEIDILIYGNGLNYFEYRTNMYRKLKSYCEKNNIKIHYAELLYENKNNLLKNI